MTRGLFIAGTDTGVGKTCVASLICREARAAGLLVGAYKPVCSGATLGPEGRLLWDDVEQLWQATGAGFERVRICPQSFLEPLAPNVAARAEGRAIDERLLLDGAAWWNDRVDLLIVEGAGGLLSPVSDRWMVADLAAELGYPIVLVARLGLGTINHTLLSVEAAERRGLPIAGIVFSQTSLPAGPSEATNPAEVAARTTAPVLGILPHGPADRLRDVHATGTIDWFALAGQGRPTAI